MTRPTPQRLNEIRGTVGFVTFGPLGTISVVPERGQVDLLAEIDALTKERDQARVERLPPSGARGRPGRRAVTRLRLLARAAGDLLYPLALASVVTLAGLALVERGLEVARVRGDNSVLRAEMARLEAQSQALQGIVRRYESADVLRASQKLRR